MVAPDGILNPKFSNNIGFPIESYDFDPDRPIWKLFFRFEDDDLMTEDIEEASKIDTYEQYIDTKDYDFLKNRSFISRSLLGEKKSYSLKKFEEKHENYLLVQELKDEESILSYANEICSKKIDSLEEINHSLVTLHFTRSTYFNNKNVLEICDWDICGCRGFYYTGIFIGNFEEVINFQKNHPKAIISPEGIFTCIRTVFEQSLFYSLSPSFRFSIISFFEKHKPIRDHNLHKFHEILEYDSTDSEDSDESE